MWKGIDVTVMGDWNSHAYPRIGELALDSEDDSKTHIHNRRESVFFGIDFRPHCTSGTDLTRLEEQKKL